ncbi:MAG: decarboxylating 6-phosphogluconate dehydrogenase [Myxococcales bacterium]|nr:decarboxylating 6-phosphogluconate dehydrogenase [Myxococcales bacterium]USN50056.1 MAG: decarboxylating 6-phosphogluconate dehydrogenase [Myxococcales bacterium]
MQIAIVGLGRMGQNMAKRLLDAGHLVVGYDRSPQVRADMNESNMVVVNSLQEIHGVLKPPRVVWVMVTHGDPTHQVIQQLKQVLEFGDIVVDGGNSHFVDSIKHNKDLSHSGINFLDVGVSGGVFGLKRGYCLMAGGDEKIFWHLEPIFKSLAPGEHAASKTKNRKVNHSSAHQGYYYCGKSGSGHYVKMVHNAIEYGMMQSFAEGFELLKNADVKHLPEEQQFYFDLREISELWRRGSVVGSWLLDLLSHALHQDPHLDSFFGHVPDSGEGRWALMEAIKQNTPSPNLANSLFTRFRSRQEQSFSEKTLSALRKEFGGHSEDQDKK